MRASVDTAEALFICIQYYIKSNFCEKYINLSNNNKTIVYFT